MQRANLDLLVAAFSGANCLMAQVKPAAPLPVDETFADVNVRQWLDMHLDTVQILWVGACKIATITNNVPPVSLDPQSPPTPPVTPALPPSVVQPGGIASQLIGSAISALSGAAPAAPGAAKP